MLNDILCGLKMCVIIKNPTQHLPSGMKSQIRNVDFISTVTSSLLKRILLLAADTNKLHWQAETH